MKYEDILNRMVEIITISEKKKKELEAQSMNNKNVNSQRDNDFMVFYPYYIYKEYILEFEELRNQELTYHILKTDKYAGLKNQALIKECISKINDNVENKGAYEELINIINRSNGKSASELCYVNGYFICRNDLERFKEICNMYKVGFAKKIIDSKDEAMELIESTKNDVLEQKSRVQEHINKLNSVVSDSKNNSFDLNIDNENSKSSDLNITLNCKYKEIVYLGMLGYLNTNMIVELKNVMSDSEFKELLDILNEYMIFSHDELLNIGLDVNEKIKDFKTIDELVAYFAIRENLNIEALKILIPSIGLDNYHYLMDQLFKFNKIDMETYSNYLKEFNFITDDVKYSR